MPKYQIDTIPVWDAYHKEGECPLCTLARICDEQFVQSALGGSVMDPDIRVMVNEKGYCSRHFAALLGQQNKLGVALMTHTHFKDVWAEMQAHAEKLQAGIEQEEQSSMPVRAVRRIAKNAPSLELARAFADAVEKRTHSCILCDKLDEVMQRYIATVVAMWRNEDEFKAAFASGKGYCMEHFAALLRAGADSLTGKEQRQFLSTLTTVQMENMERLEGEVEWFTLKFDYRNHDKPWGTSVDAPERAINKLRSRTLPEEKKEEKK